MYGADPKKVNKRDNLPYREGSIKRDIVASDLVQERANCNFDQDELCRFIEPLLESKKEFMTLVENTPELANTHKFYEMTTTEKQENLWSRVHHLFTHSPELRRMCFDDYDPVAPPFFHWPFYFQGTLPGGMHVLMGYTAMATLANDKQKEYWLPKLRRWEVIACYAQTELGHGSNIAGLETTATFDKKTNEFVINSPTPTSTKWWPGDLSRFCNYAIVYAKLILDGQQAGVQPFLVQLRKKEDFSVMPGIKLGDMGPKFGYQSKDNGWMQFDNVRIPKDQMLSKFSQVDEEGNLEIMGDLRVLYAVMMMVRLHIVRNAAYLLMKPLKVSIRYACVRRQFKTLHGSKQERKIMDYQTHMYKLGPLLARAYIMQVNGELAAKRHEQLLVEIKDSNFQLLDISHHILSGYKALFTDWVFNGLEEARIACGGAGYTAWSGFAEMHQFSSPQQTFEGDNTVMLQQSSRYLFKLLKKASKGKQIEEPFSYINEINAVLAKGFVCKAKSAEDFLDLATIDEAFKVKTAFMACTVTKAYAASFDSEKEKANGLFAQEVNDMAKCHLKYISFATFVKTCRAESFKDKNILPTMELLAKVFALSELTADCQQCFASGYFADKSAYTNLHKAYKLALKKLRPMMVPLVEVMYIPDNVLISAIGNRHGDIYETQLEWAQTSRVGDKIPDYYDKYIKPILHGAKL